MIFDVLSFNARRQPDALALIDAVGALTHLDTLRVVAALARALVAAVPGIGALDLIGFACADARWHMLLAFALETLGVATMPFSQPVEAGVRAALGRCQLILVEHDEAGVAALRIDVAWMEQAAATAAGATFRPAQWSRSDVVAVVTTSGSIGAMKCMALDRERYDLREHNRVWQYGFDAASEYLVVMPVTVSMISIAARAALRCGGTLRFADPTNLIAGLASASHVTLLPAGASGLLARLPASVPPRVAGDLKCWLTGAPLGAPLRDALLGRLNAEVWDSYGTSETGPLARIGSGGVAEVLPEVEVEVVGSDMQVLPRGVPGILCARSAEMVSGYIDSGHDDWFRDGWFLTGDRAVALGPRQFRLLGRRDTMLNLGGTKVATEELEDLLAREGIAADVAVCALADRNGIDRLHIGLAGPRVGDDQLIARIDALLGRGFGDVRVIVLERIPRGEAGKIQRAHFLEVVRARLRPAD